MSTDDRSNDSPTSSEAEKVDTEGNADNAVVEGAVENVVDNDLVDEPTGDELAGDESAADERAGGDRLIVWCLVALLVGIGASAASGFWWYKIL